MTVLNPPFVTGPAFQAPASPADLPSTLKIWYNLVVVPGEKARPAVLANAGWVDVRDLAEAHVRALEIQEAGSERIIVSEGVYIFQEWLDIANKVKPEGYKKELPKGLPELTAGISTYNLKYDISKASRVLNIRYRTKEETTRDILEWVAERGW
ncbi:hypothetical protein D9611_011295 [Ephemerocybe angulata]|uniref:NAD-dependent epimerase/dehydratase domain-containing protein n=1 Tax=Ephemerocybe angulata TaxID=980116 RepID=A0A8H5F1X1_9AGAR|nr:hypothetical protein D9611_011295 [Tulosesus angulatus]